MIAADSSVLIDWMRGAHTPQTRCIDRLELPGDLIIGDLIFAEIMQGARDEAQAVRYEAMLMRFRWVRMADREVARQAAAMRRVMRAAGYTPRGVVDLLVGAFCIGAGVTLLARDRDFDAMERHCGLRIERGLPDA